MLREARSPLFCFIVYFTAFPLFYFVLLSYLLTFAYLNCFYYEKTFYYYLYGTCVP